MAGCGSHRGDASCGLSPGRGAANVRPHRVAEKVAESTVARPLDLVGGVRYRESCPARDSSLLGEVRESSLRRTELLTRYFALATNVSPRPASRGRSSFME